MRDVDRLIDANANRAREALRVMEDAARFLLDDREAASALKSLRHDLTATTARLGPVTCQRDVEGDVGRDVTTPSEQTRVTTADVVTAAAKRLGEALRSLEEYAKTRDPDVAAEFERLRYAGYDQSAALLARLGRRARQWSVCVLLTDAVMVRPWQDVVDDVLAAAPDAVQLREPELPDGELLTRPKYLVAHATPATAVVVNDRPDIARLAGAHGVHVGQADLPVREVRRLVGDAVVGMSTSCLEEAKKAKADGADYCGVGPMFPTTTKHMETIAGTDYLHAYIKWNGLPHLAIGGITEQNLPTLVAAGAHGIAVCATVCAAPQPGDVVGALRATLTGNLAPSTGKPG